MGSKKLIRYLFIVFQVGIYIHVNGQTLPFRNYNTEHGLPSSETYDVLQDREGLIWISTDAGVCRFDGYNFKKFNSKQNLVDNTVFGIFEDSKGRIWFRSYTGKLCYYKEGKIYDLPEVNKHIRKYNMGFYQTSMYVDSKDTIWIGLVRNSGYVKIHPGFRKTEYIQLVPEGTYIMEIEKGKYIFGGGRNQKIQNYRINMFQKQKLLRSLEYGFDSSVTFGPTHRMTVLRDGTIFYSDVAVYNFIKGDKIISSHINHENIISVFQDRNNDLWIGTLSGKLYIIDKSNPEVKPREVYSGESISAITQDREGGLWFTTLNNGVMYLSNKYCVYLKIKNEEGYFNSVFIDPLKKIILASQSGKVYTVVNERTDEVEQLKISPDIKIFRFIRLGDKIFCCANQTFILDNDKISFTRRSGKPFINSKVAVYDGKDFVYASNHNEFFKINIQTNKVEKCHAMLERIIDMAINSKGEIYLATIGGLYKYKDNKFTSLKNLHPLFQSRIETVKFDDKDNLWLSVKDEGILLWNGKKLRVFSEMDGLIGDACRTLFVEGNTVWAGTDKGINRITFNQNHQPLIKNICIYDGLKSNEIRQIIKSDSFIYALSNKGIIKVDNRVFNQEPLPLEVKILNAKTNFSQYNINKRIEIPYFDNYLHIGFIGLSFKYAGALRYRYKLEGLNNQWYTTTSTSVQYPSLPEGEYTFKVYALAPDGSRTRVPATISFLVSPPFWKKWSFILVCILAISLIVMTIIFYRIKRFKEKQKVKIEFEKQLAGFRLQALRAQMNPHFIFNAISSVQHFILINETSKSYNYLARFAKLIRIVLDSSSNDKIRLSDELEMLELYISLEQLRFDDSFSYQINVAPGIDADEIFVPVMLIQPFVENAISHGLIPRTDDCRLKLEFTRTEEHLKISIIDNGIGRKKSAEMKANRKHLSKGMLITSERLDVIRRRDNIHLDVKIEDLYDNHLGVGTRVNISIPINE